MPAAPASDGGLHVLQVPLRAARSLGCDDTYDLWPPEYGWWLNKRKANLPGDPRA